MIVLLDSGPLGLLANPTLSPQRGAVGRWVIALRTAGVRVYVPEITDYEVRRELLRTNRTQAIARLDALAASAGYLSLTTAAMRKAAEFWAQARQRGGVGRLHGGAGGQYTAHEDRAPGCGFSNPQDARSFLALPPLL